MLFGATAFASAQNSDFAVLKNRSQAFRALAQVKMSTILGSSAFPVIPTQPSRNKIIRNFTFGHLMFRLVVLAQVKVFTIFGVAIKKDSSQNASSLFLQKTCGIPYSFHTSTMFGCTESACKKTSDDGTFICCDAFKTNRVLFSFA